jgi:hypothetical protein
LEVFAETTRISRDFAAKKSKTGHRRAGNSWE